MAIFQNMDQGKTPTRLRVRSCVSITAFVRLEKIAEGGMNIVYKAEDTMLKRHVALKFTSAQLLTDKAKKARFIHEARAVAALNHSNKGIVVFKDFIYRARE